MKISKLETRGVHVLTPHAKNARIHSAEQVKQIAASMREFGFTTPILIDENNGIIAGHGRLEAAISLGIENVPVLVASGWTEDQKRAYVIADNKLALNSEWDKGLLVDELKELAGVEFDLSSLGFTDNELRGLILDLPDDEPVEEEDAPASSKTTRLGLGSPIIQFNIVFDDEVQQQEWFGFVRELKGLYPEEETLGARLSAYLRERTVG